MGKVLSDDNRNPHRYDVFPRMATELDKIDRGVTQTLTAMKLYAEQRDAALAQVAELEAQISQDAERLKSERLQTEQARSRVDDLRRIIAKLEGGP